MTVDYEYPNKTNEPNLAGIHTDVASSEMTNKNIQFCKWNKCTKPVRKGRGRYKPGEEWPNPECTAECEKLIVTWDTTLSSEDEDILDGIVAANS